jgi:hypothetical protein
VSECKVDVRVLDSRHACGQETKRAFAHERDHLSFPQPRCREGLSFFLSVRVARSPCSPRNPKIVHLKYDIHAAPPAQSFSLRTKSLHGALHSIPMCQTLKSTHVRLGLPIETGTSCCLRSPLFRICPIHEMCTASHRRGDHSYPDALYSSYSVRASL